MASLRSRSPDTDPLSATAAQPDTSAEAPSASLCVKIYESVYLLRRPSKVDEGFTLLGGGAVPQNPFDLRRNLRSLFQSGSKSQLEVLDGLRAWAVLWVISVHCCQFIGIEYGTDDKGVYTWRAGEARKLLWSYFPMQLPLAGDMGVDVFFVLSGFLIYKMLTQELDRNGYIHYGKFFVRRWLRIFPAYAFALMINKAPLMPPCQRWGWTNLLFINNMVGPQVGDSFTSCMGHTWSIALEMQFYIFSPPLVALMTGGAAGVAECRVGGLEKWPSRLTVLLPVSLVVLSLLIRTTLVFATADAEGMWVPPSADIVYDKLYTRCSPYLFGMLAAAAHQSDAPFVPRGCSDSLASTVAGALALTLCFLGSGNAFVQRQPPALNLLLVLFSRAALGACTSLLLVQMLRGRCTTLSRILSSGVWTPFARLSYSAYLLQFNVVMPLGQTFFDLRGVNSEFVAFSWYLLYLVTAVLASFGIALVSYLVVEKPVINLRPFG